MLQGASLVPKGSRAWYLIVAVAMMSSVLLLPPIEIVQKARPSITYHEARPDCYLDLRCTLESLLL